MRSVLDIGVAASLPCGIGRARSPAERPVDDQPFILVRRSAEALPQRGTALRYVRADRDIESVRKVTIGFLPHDEIHTVTRELRSIFQVHRVAKAETFVVGNLGGPRIRAQ